MTTRIGTSGISKIVLRYYENINKNNIKIDFIVPNEPNEEIRKKFSDNKTIFWIERNRKNIIKYYNDIKRIIKDGEYDIVHVHGNSATMAIEMMAAKDGGCKNRIAHTHNTKTSHKIIDKILRPVLYKNATTLFACGKEAGRNLYGNRKFYIIPNGNNLRKYEFNIEQRKKYRNLYKINKNEILIGHVGRFNEQKNHEYILNILNGYKKDDNVKLLLMGSGFKEKEIKEKVNNSDTIKNRVIFTGEIQNVNEVINACDAMILPSKYEGFPVVAIEWQANGLPIIASDKISKEIDKTDSITFVGIANEDTELWRKRINEIKYKENERKLKSKNNCQILKKEGFDIEDDAKKLEEIYQKLYETK